MKSDISGKVARQIQKCKEKLTGKLKLAEKIKDYFLWSNKSNINQTGDFSNWLSLKNDILFPPRLLLLLSLRPQQLHLVRVTKVAVSLLAVQNLEQRGV